MQYNYFFYPEARGVSREAMFLLNNMTEQVTRKMTKIWTSLDTLKECLAAAPPLSLPHRDGWRNELLEALTRDDVCDGVVTSFIANVANGRVPRGTA